MFFIHCLLILDHICVIICCKCCLFDLPMKVASAAAAILALWRSNGRCSRAFHTARASSAPERTSFILAAAARALAAAPPASCTPPPTLTPHTFTKTPADALRTSSSSGRTVFCFLPQQYRKFYMIIAEYLNCFFTSLFSLTYNSLFKENMKKLLQRLCSYHQPD